MNARRIFLLAVIAVVAAIVIYFALQVAHESAERSDAIESSVQDAVGSLQSGDPSAALRILSKAIGEHPDEPALHLVAARAYCARGRYKDALDSLAKAGALELDSEQSGELRFLTGRAYAGRYLETGASDERKLAEAELGSLDRDARFGAAAKILIARVLTRKPSAASADERSEAIGLLEEGLADSSARQWLHDFDDAQQHLEALKAATPGG